MHHPSIVNSILLAAAFSCGLVACSSVTPGVSLQDVVTGRAALRKDGPGSRSPELPGAQVTWRCKLGSSRVSTSWRSDPYVTSMTLHESSIEFIGIEYPEDRRRSQYRWKVEVPTDYRPTAVAARSADDYYLAGERTWGSLSLERWQLAPLRYGFTVTRPVATEPLGSPATAGSTTVIQSPHYHEPDQRRAPHFHVAELPVPDEWLWVRQLAADPDGRYLLALVETAHDDSTLYRYELATQTAHVVADGEQQPALILCESIQFADRENGDRVALLRTTTGHTLMLIDADHDGIHEAFELHDFYSSEHHGALKLARRY